MNSLRLLDPRVASAFYGRFASLREVQQATIEPILFGRNVIVSSGTGSGKTEAVMAPLISRLWREAVKNDSLILLYISPTKALVNDLEKRLYQPLSSLGLRVGVRHGDRDDLASGKKPHVLISTPESLDVMLFRKEKALQDIRAVVIDEVHLLYNTQRGLQLSILLKRLEDTLCRSLQWVALSATISDLSDINTFLALSDEEPVLLSFPSHRIIEALITHVNTETGFLNIIQRLSEGRSTKLLVFVNSRWECERLASILQYDARLRESVFVHYSSLSPEVRLDTEKKFARLNSAICIATSTLELGIDIGDIDVVLLWGVPGGVESFIQRIGRGNRRSNKTNVVCMIQDTSESVGWDALRFASLVTAASHGEIPRRRPYQLYGAVAQQILSVIASEGGRFTRVADLYRLVQHMPYIDRGVLESILAQLAVNGFLKAHGFKNQFGATESLHKLVDFKLIYSNLGTESQTISLYHDSKWLGDVPTLNLLQLHVGAKVRFAGKCWHVKKILRHKVLLDPAKPGGSLDFIYMGGKVHTDSFVTNRVWRLLHDSEFPSNLFTSSLSARILEARNRFQRACRIDQIPYIWSEDGVRYFTFAGYMVNKAIGLISGNTKFEATDTSLFVPSAIDWRTIPSEPDRYRSVFPFLFEESSERSFYQTQLPPNFQLREFIESWLKDEAVAEVLERLANSSPVEVDATSVSFFTDTY